MVRNRTLIIDVFLFLFLVVAVVVFFGEGNYTLSIIAVGVTAFFIGDVIATNFCLGKPIPFRYLCSREYVLVKRIDSSLSLVSIMWEGFDTVILVKGCPKNIKEMEIFVPSKKGLVSIVTRHETGD